MRISRRSTLDTRRSVAVDAKPDHIPAKPPKMLRSQFGQNYDGNSARNSYDDPLPDYDTEPVMMCANG
jgi:hypothetical protein